MIINSLMRGIIPLAIMSGIATLLYFQKNYSDARSTLFTGFIIFFVAAGSVIYDVDDWSLLKRSIIHFSVMVITIYPILLLSDWFDVSSLFDALKVFIIFLLVGLALWSLFMVLAKVFSW